MLIFDDKTHQEMKQTIDDHINSVHAVYTLENELFFNTHKAVTFNSNEDYERIYSLIDQAKTELEVAHADLRFPVAYQGVEPNIIQRVILKLIGL